MQPTSPQDPPDVQAVLTIGNVHGDLTKIIERLPVPAADIEPIALQLEHLACELGQAAMLVRTWKAEAQS